MERRTFLKRSFAAVSGVMAAIVGIPAIRYLLDPLARSRQRGRFIRVLPLSALVPGKPVRANVIADRTDAYTHYPPGTVGQVFLIRDPDGPKGPGVRCLQVICPHLGCAVDHVPGRDVFACPCHDSDFDQDGRRLKGPSPRDLDPLVCRISEIDASGQHWVEVEYQEFKAGIAERIAKT
jgi:Rieske Fe-S protein